MTYLRSLVLISCVTIMNSFGQSRDSIFVDPLINHMAYSTPATILPYFSVGLGGSAMPYGTLTPEYRGYAFVNVQDIGEISINNEELISDYAGSLLRSPLMYKIKLSLISETPKLPAISFSFQTMFSWEDISYWSLSDKPEWASQGLEEVWYDYSVYTANITVTKEIANGFLGSIGAGIKNIQFKSIVMFTATPIQWNWNRYDNPGITKNIIPSGYINGQYRFNDRWSILGEIQNYPSLTPNVVDKSIHVSQSYYMALGARLSFVRGMGLCVVLREVVPHIGASSFDILLGLSLALPNQSLKLTE